MTSQRICRLFMVLAGIWLALVANPATAAFGTPVPADAPEAELNYLGRHITVLRATLPGAQPEARVARALRRIGNLEHRHLSEKVQLIPLQLAGENAFAVHIGTELIFTLLDSDREPGSSLSLETTANAAALALQDSIDARRAQQDPELLLQGLVNSLIALAAALLLAVVVLRLRQRAARALDNILAHRLKGAATWLVYLTQITDRLVQILLAVVVFAIIYIWLTWALQQFPVTAAFGDTLGNFLIDLLARVGGGAIDALPGLITLLVIWLIARAVVQSVDSFFDALSQGRFEIPGLYAETLPATRRITAVAIWAIALTFAYPHIPGSSSDAFKGLSVLFGFMITLGSSGLVSQMMGGLALVYSRALKPGEMVQIGDTVGVVREVGTLSTKLVNIYNEEITLPNSLIASSQVRNFSRQGRATVRTEVTIGYDTPWRQVHAMLLAAAGKTAGISADPAPYVLQRSLDDFYVRYEVIAVLNEPLTRMQVLSDLNANVQDEFNSYGVQIMSPNFEAQPDRQVLVPRENWYAAPARPDDK